MNNFKIKAIFLSVIMGPTFLAQADAQNTPLNTTLLVQRCVAADVIIDKNTTEKTASTDCIWRSKNVKPDGTQTTEDADMQISLKIADDVDKVGVHCIFTPSNLDNTSRDSIADVAVSKGATPNNSAAPSQLPAGSWFRYVTDAATGQTEIMAMVPNYKNNVGADHIHHQANIIFDLNKERNIRWHQPFTNVTFNENDTINCTFSANVVPALSAGNKQY